MALVPPFFIKAVVALGFVQINPSVTPATTKWVNEGTGFFYGYLVENHEDVHQRKYELYLVTAKHVVAGHLTTRTDDMHVRINPDDRSSPVKSFVVPRSPSAGQNTWFYHPDPKIDVAAVRIDPSFLKNQGIDPGNFFANDQFVADVSKMKEIGISAGDGTFVLGLPIDLAGENRNDVIVRQGCIARIEELLQGSQTSFMLDTFVWPGNSGSPAILKPEAFSIEGTKSIDRAWFIGLVTSYRGTAATTSAVGLVVQSNTGLAEVLPADYINEAIKAWKESRK